MWLQIKSAPNLMMAEMWKEFFEGEGVPTRVLSYPDATDAQNAAEFRVYIPEEKDHVVEEILRKA